MKKRLLALLLVMALSVSFYVNAEEDYNDDTEIPEAEATEIPGEDGEGIPVEVSDQESENGEARILQYGVDGDDVLALQVRLHDLGYYSGNLSGRFREGTRASVKAFQKDYDLNVTGIADEITLETLKTARYRPLQYGSKGDDVKKLQTRLTELGYYKGKISGNYLEGSRYGIELFQEKVGLEKTGVADPETLEAIYLPDAPGRYDDVNATDAPTPTPQFENFLVSDDENANEPMMPDEAVAFSKKLQYGSSGKTVKQLQQRLTDLGYYTGPVSGSFQGNTRNAVKKVQTQNAMKETGVVDEATWNLIFNDVTIVMPDATAKPTPEPTPVPFAITVDVRNQAVTVYTRDENGEYTVPVRQMICSTGTKANPSDVGDWTLNGRKANWCVFPQWGNSYARYWTRINSSIAFHSVIYNAVNVMSMKTSSYKKLGQRASHGCIRLTVADAKWIYDNVGKGTVVTITEKLPDDPELRDSLKLPPLDTKKMEPQKTPLPTAEPAYVSDQTPTFELRDLKQKSTGEDVYWLQRRLTDLGYYHGKCSGTFLGGTAEAVKAWKKDHGMSANNVADVKMQQAMYAESVAEVQAAAEATAPETTPTPAEVQ